MNMLIQYVNSMIGVYLPAMYRYFVLAYVQDIHTFCWLYARLHLYDVYVQCTVYKFVSLQNIMFYGDHNTLQQIMQVNTILTIGQIELLKLVLIFMSSVH